VELNVHSFSTPSWRGAQLRKIQGTPIRVPGVLSPRIKRPGREADHSPPTNAEDKTCGAIPSLPVRLHGVVLS